MSRGDDIIRASEIGQYTFCARAWWYRRVKGHPSANVAALQRGTARHVRHGRAVASYYRLRRLALFLLTLAALALLAWLLLSLGR
jgi:3-mercaptopyruvate sulfurtransferase SseA